MLLMKDEWNKYNPYLMTNDQKVWAHVKSFAFIVFDSGSMERFKYMHLHLINVLYIRLVDLCLQCYKLWPIIMYVKWHILAQPKWGTLYNIWRIYFRQVLDDLHTDLSNGWGKNVPNFPNTYFLQSLWGISSHTPE